MGPLLTVGVTAQTVFWAWASWKIAHRAKTRRAALQIANPLLYPTGDWLLALLFAAFAIGSFFVLLGY